MADQAFEAFVGFWVCCWVVEESMAMEEEREVSVEEVGVGLVEVPGA